MKIHHRYIQKVESCEYLKECRDICDNFEDLKENVKLNDEIILVSGFSIYNFDVMQMLSLHRRQKN